MGKDVKIIWGVVISTVVIIVGGIMFMNRDNSNSPAPTTNPNFLVRENSIKITAPKEKVVLVEFGDLQCPSCAAYQPLVNKLKVEFKDNMSFVYRHFPLSGHKNAKPAAYALEAAGVQNKYWEMMDKLFENQQKWADMVSPESAFLEYAKELGLDQEKLKKDMSSSTIKSKVDNDYADGIALGVNSTPTFFVNGAKAPNVKSYEDFASLIQAAILNKEAEVSDEGEYHIHYDLLVIQNGKQLDFSQSKYQSTKENEIDSDTHVHNNKGQVVHIHKEGTTLGQFFRSVGLTPKGKLFVNNKEVVGDIMSYAPKDLDRIIVSDSANIDYGSVSDDACIYSEKCPERGTPPPEECVGGLGTGCE